MANSGIFHRNIFPKEYNSSWRSKSDIRSKRKEGRKQRQGSNATPGRGSHVTMGPIRHQAKKRSFYLDKQHSRGRPHSFPSGSFPGSEFTVGKAGDLLQNSPKANFRPETYPTSVGRRRELGAHTLHIQPSMDRKGRV